MIIVYFFSNKLTMKKEFAKEVKAGFDGFIYVAIAGFRVDTLIKDI